MGYYIATVATLMVLIIFGLILPNLWRNWKEEDGRGKALVGGMIVFMIGGAAMLLPMLWMMAADEPLF